MKTKLISCKHLIGVRTDGCQKMQTLHICVYVMTSILTPTNLYLQRVFFRLCIMLAACYLCIKQKMNCELGIRQLKMHRMNRILWINVFSIVFMCMFVCSLFPSVKLMIAFFCFTQTHQLHSNTCFY